MNFFTPYICIRLSSCQGDFTWHTLSHLNPQPPCEVRAAAGTGSSHLLLSTLPGVWQPEVLNKYLLNERMSPHFTDEGIEGERGRHGGNAKRCQSGLQPTRSFPSIPRQRHYKQALQTNKSGNQCACRTTLSPVSPSRMPPRRASR